MTSDTEVAKLRPEVVLLVKHGTVTILITEITKQEKHTIMDTMVLVITIIAATIIPLKKQFGVTPTVSTRYGIIVTQFKHVDLTSEILPRHHGLT